MEAKDMTLLTLVEINTALHRLEVQYGGPYPKNQGEFDVWKDNVEEPDHSIWSNLVKLKMDQEAVSAYNNRLKELTNPDLQGVLFENRGKLLEWRQL